MAQILVVDDSAAIRNEVSSFLSENGFTVDTAVDGADGLNKAREATDLKLILSDINMPNVDGLTMVEKIRDELGNKTVNILMLTTDNDPNMKARGKAAGVKGWIVKPFNGAAALGVIGKLVS